MANLGSSSSSSSSSGGGGGSKGPRRGEGLKWFQKSMGQTDDGDIHTSESATTTTTYYIIPFLILSIKHATCHHHHHHHHLLLTSWDPLVDTPYAVVGCIHQQ